MSRDSARSTAGAAGVDRITAAQFGSSLSDQVIGIRESVRAGTYRFAQLRAAPVLKPSGGYRMIAVPTVRDRLLQRVILRHLEGEAKLKKLSPISYGFTKSRTLAMAQKTALQLRKKLPFVLQADIIRFFDEIPRPKLRVLIRRNVGWRIVSGLVSDAVGCEIEDSSAAFAAELGIQRGRGLRQGMPLSPFLSNLLLRKFDETLARKGISAVRYADDLAIFGESERECRTALKLIREQLASLELRIPDLEDEGKTVLRGPSEPIEFLGVEIRRAGDDYTLCPPAQKLEKIEAAMAEMISIPRLVQERRDLGRVARSLESLIIGHNASMAVIDDRQDFFARLEAAKRRQLRALMENLIGRGAFKKLDEQRLAILGLHPFPEKKSANRHR